VILAADGADAVSIFGSRGGEIDAVLTDISMPIMDGPATIHVLRRMNPQLPIIATSGRATKEQLERIAGLHIGHFLAKPSTATELLTELKRALAEKQL
jgi:CheY-like chemotaxis protein